MEKIIHQIWIGPHRIPRRESGWIDKIRDTHPDYQHILWTDENLRTLSLPPDIQYQVDNRYSKREWAFVADVLRIWVVYEYGGIYLDADMEPYDGFRHTDIAGLNGIFHHNEPTDPTIPNDTVGLHAKHPLAAYLLASMTRDRYDFGPNWLGLMARRYYGLDDTAGHAQVREALNRHGIAYLPSVPTFQALFTHRALYSWSDENKKRFDVGDYE